MHKLFNGPIYVLAKVIKSVMASAMEAEIAAMFMNAQKIIHFRHVLTDMGHPQPPTRMRTDSKSGSGLVTGTMRQKRSKAIDMRFNWLKDRAQNHKELDIQWAPGAANLGDYPTKHHTGKHHLQCRPVFLNVDDKSPTTLQGCAKILNPTQSQISGTMSIEGIQKLIRHNLSLLPHILTTTVIS